MNSHDIVRAGDIMNTKFILVDGLATVAEALARLKEEQALFTIVRKRHENDEFGIVLLSDIAKMVISKDRSPERINVYEIMSKPVVSVRPSMDIRYTARLFQHLGIQAAPVLHSGEILGIVTYEEIALSAAKVESA